MINVPICILIIIHWLHTGKTFNIDVSIIFINDRLFHLNEFALICLKKTSYKKQKCCWCLHVLLLLWIIHLSLWLGISNSLKKDLPKKRFFYTFPNKKNKTISILLTIRRHCDLLTPSSLFWSAHNNTHCKHTTWIHEHYIPHCGIGNACWTEFCNVEC